MIEFRTLGRLELKDDHGRELTRILAQPKRTALLAYLAAATPRGFHRRDSLIGIFWPEMGDARARASLRKTIHSLRQVLGEGVLIGRGDEELGIAAGALFCDAVAFDEAADSGQAARAIEWYGGNFLAGFYLSNALEFEHWVERERTCRRQKAFEAAWQLALSDEKAGNGFGAAAWARRAANLAPDDEPALRRVLALLDRVGDRAGAVAVYDDFARGLAQEYDVLPSEETQAVIHQIRAVRRPAVTPVPAEPSSIAVLPFINLTADSDAEFLGDGITEELIHWLTRIDGLRVAARSSSFLFKGKGADVGEVGRRLNVATVLEGSVRVMGKRLKIAAQLIDASDGYHMWSEVYERQLDDVFLVQEEIAHAIVAALRSKFTDQTTPPIHRHGTSNYAAYELYLKGRFFWNQRTEPGLLRGIDCFQKAIACDARFARAHAGLADGYNQLAIYGFMPGAHGYPLARAAAQAALALDPASAEAYASLGFTYGQHDWDWGSAEQALRHAIALDPQYATAHQWYNSVLMTVGRVHEGTRELEQARALDPLSMGILTDIARDCYLAREYDCALRQARAALDVDPHFARAHGALAMILVELHDYDAAIKEFRTAIDLAGGWYPTRWGQAGLARGLALAGRISESREVFATLMEPGDRYVSPEMIALVYAALGEVASACAELDCALAERSINLVFALRDPAFDPLRSLPSFERLLERSGLRPLQTA